MRQPAVTEADRSGPVDPARLYDDAAALEQGGRRGRRAASGQASDFPSPPANFIPLSAICSPQPPAGIAAQPQSLLLSEKLWQWFGKDRSICGEGTVTRIPLF